MDRGYLEGLVRDAFDNSFNEENFKRLISQLLKVERFTNTPIEIIKDFEGYIESCKRIFSGDPVDVLIVELKEGRYVERSRYIQRRFVEWYLKNKTDKDQVLVAFYNKNFKKWRFSYVEFSYKLSYTEEGKRTALREISPTRRFSYLVGEGEKNYTPISNFVELLSKETIQAEDIKAAFSVEKITEEFFEAFKHALYEVLMKNIKPEQVQDSKKFFFSLQLLSRIMFIYFIQRKGWLKWKNYEQDENYLRNLWNKYKEYSNKSGKKDLFYNSWLHSLFFGAFNKKSELIDESIPEDIRESFITMPYLNGGLFSKNELDQMGFVVPDKVFEWLFEPDFSTNDKKKGFLEVFNFTIDESMPLDVEVAVDPEMLGKVYESLISEKEREKAGIFYTPRVEIDLMCRLSLVEYLYEKTKIPKEELIDFVFYPQKPQDSISKEKARAIKSALDKVKIVDPAVGSASFLVGMMNVLVELHTELTKRIEEREENLFALKKKILRDNLYGVDVKDWAVMMGELRLWLSLVIESDEKEMDIYTRPLLPNLSFKIRQGDSLVEEVGGVPFYLRSEYSKYAYHLKNQIRKLVDKKNDFFSGSISANLKEEQEIRSLEHEILDSILESKIREIDAKIQRLNVHKTQKDAFGGGRKKHEDITQKSLEQEKAKYEKIRENLKNGSKRDYFLWEISFAEVFGENGGFDIVIGNPPYVRQEMLGREYKDKLKRSLKAIWKDVEVDGRSDLYVYFYYHGLSLLRPGGVLCFITSNSWLDVGYGAGLQEFLLKKMRPIYIIDNLKKRSFQQADVNTIIALIQRPEKELEDYTIKFIAFKKPFEEVANAEVIKRIESYNEPVFDDEDFRLYPKTKKDLLLEGSEIEEEGQSLYNNLRYIGNKWGGKYLRAPEIYFKILEKGKGKLVRLGDIAEVRFGIKTGANEFFYLKPIGRTVKEVVEIAEKNPNALIPVRNGAGWEGEIEAEFLKPVIKSPRELKTIIVRLEDLNNLVFMCHKDKRELEGTKALEYIEWGEGKGYHNRSTCRERARWWDLGEWKISKNILPMFERERKYCFFNEANSFIDAALYWCYPKGVEEWVLNLLLNSALIGLWKELLCRPPEGGGGGPIQMKVYHYEEMPIPSLEHLNFHKSIFEKFIINEIPSIFTELGFDPNKPIREQEPNPPPDRKALDDIVFDALGLTEEERKEVYWAVAELVKNRLDKARSV